VARTATRRYYVRKFGILYLNVGMDRAFTVDPGIVPLDGDKELAPGIHALVGFERKANYLTTSVNLYMRKGLGFKRDDFSHELALVIREGDTACIFSSCSHSGLHNIMGKISDVGLLAAKNLVFAGMHLYRAPGTQTESPAILDRFAADLLAFPDTTYFAGHCTGRIAFERLSATMGERLKPLRCGDVFEL
jgi:7,8-dihydropterin-6-yl-methyl-4-(beta-D-ribofuranosyl)aminobenzene 5'-phosphate synthase